jgi:hypothetical protein
MWRHGVLVGSLPFLGLLCLTSQVAVAESTTPTTSQQRIQLVSSS